MGENATLNNKCHHLNKNQLVKSSCHCRCL